MIPITLQASMLVGLPLLSAVTAQDLASVAANPEVKITGCPEFGCPNSTVSLERDWDVAECKLGNDTLFSVGIAESVFSVPGSDAKLSFTMDTLILGAKYDEFSG